MAEQANAVAGALATAVSPGDQVCMLGFPSPDHLAIDLVLIQLGAVAVPLQSTVPVSQLVPIALETEPTVIAAGHVTPAMIVEYITDLPLLGLL